MIYNYDALSFQILTVMRSKHRKGFFEVKGRPYASISIKLEGSASFEIMGENLFVGEKDIVYIPANMDYKASYHEPNDSIVVHFSECNCKEPQSISVENKELIEYLFLNLLESFEKTHSHNQAKACIYDILFNLSKMNSEGRNELFEKITEHIKKHYSDPELNVSAICSCFHISRTNIQKLFLEYAGISPKQYIINHRMEKVLALLTEGGYLIKDIASLCGFTDEKYLSRVFRKKYGFPPSELNNIIVV